MHVEAKQISDFKPCRDRSHRALGAGLASAPLGVLRKGCEGFRGCVRATRKASTEQEEMRGEVTRNGHGPSERSAGVPTE